MLQDKLAKLRAAKDLLLMPHLVLGYPSYQENEKAVDAMVAGGADIVEMQIAFSEPMSDGPVILRANDEALKAGATVEQSLAFAEKMTRRYPQIAFLFMTYTNIIFAAGTAAFVARVRQVGVDGLIVPDLPPDVAHELKAACAKEGVAPIFIMTPTSSDERLRLAGQASEGMVYCVGRRGVTGQKTDMDSEIDAVIKRYRAATNLPLAFGFGLQSKQDVDYLRGKVDIAVIGTKLFKVQEESGSAAIEGFLRSVDKFS